MGVLLPALRIRYLQSHQHYGFIRIFTDFLPPIRVYGRNVPNTEGETHCLLIDLPLFWLFHVSNQVRGCTRVKPGVELVAYYSYARRLALGLRACIGSLMLSAKVNEYVHGPRQGSAELHNMVYGKGAEITDFVWIKY